jgi:hypothetical protein
MPQQPESNYRTPSHEVKVIGHGAVKSLAHLEDIRDTHKRDGYIKAIVCQPISHYWEVAFPVLFIEDMPDMVGNCLILYLGTEQSFNWWMRHVMRELEKAALTRGKVPGKWLQ